MVFRLFDLMPCYSLSCRAIHYAVRLAVVLSDHSFLSVKPIFVFRQGISLGVALRCQAIHFRRRYRDITLFPRGNAHCCGVAVLEGEAGCSAGPQPVVSTGHAAPGQGGGGFRRASRPDAQARGASCRFLGMLRSVLHSPRILATAKGGGGLFFVLMTSSTSQELHIFFGT